MALYTGSPDLQTILNKYGRDAKWYEDGACIRDSLSHKYKKDDYHGVYTYDTIQEALDNGEVRALSWDVIDLVAKNRVNWGLNDDQFAEFWRQYS